MRQHARSGPPELIWMYIQRPDFPEVDEAFVLWDRMIDDGYAPALFEWNAPLIGQARRDTRLAYINLLGQVAVYETVGNGRYYILDRQPEDSPTWLAGYLEVIDVDDVSRELMERSYAHGPPFFPGMAMRPTADGILSNGLWTHPDNVRLEPLERSVGRGASFVLRPEYGTRIRSTGMIHFRSYKVLGRAAPDSTTDYGEHI